MALNKYWRTQLNNLDFLKGQINTLFWYAEHQQWNQAKFLNRRASMIYDTTEWASLPRYRKEYLAGILEERLRAYQNQHLVHCYIWEDKPLMRAEWKALFPKGKVPYHKLSYQKSGFFYKDSRKPFYPS